MLPELFEKFRPLFDNMPPVQVWEKGRKYIKCRFTLAKYCPKELVSDNLFPSHLQVFAPVIVFSPSHLYNSTPQEIENTLKHEMIHAWLDWKGLPYGHTKNFMIKYIELGLHKTSQWHNHYRSRHNLFAKTLKEYEMARKDSDGQAVQASPVCLERKELATTNMG